MNLHDLMRYGLWGGIAVTADANRRHYHMTTTWLPHFLTNTLTLLLPDLWRMLPRSHASEAQSSSVLGEALRVANATIDKIARNNPRYVIYMTPLAIGYLTSHPQFNIYKGDLAEKRFFGFGLDAIPHSTTGLALTVLVCDTTHIAATTANPEGRLATALQWCDRHRALVSGVVLVLATALWESGEYNIHRHELAQRGSVEAINMQWSVEDTLYDCLSNTIGWAVAIGAIHALGIGRTQKSTLHTTSRPRLLGF